VWRLLGKLLVRVAVFDVVLFVEEIHMFALTIRAGSADPRPRHGFTLVELLVVIAIIGVLIALLLPAVQAARESARRTQCRNKLKQIVLGMHNYHDVHNMIPINYCNYAQGGEAYAHGWLTGLLPFIEQRSLWSQIDWGGSVYTLPNHAVASTGVPAFLCPSDESVDGRMQTYASGSARWGITNYKACAGSNFSAGDAVCRHTWPRGRWPNMGNVWNQGNGIICPNSGYRPENNTRFSDIHDGLSNTFAVGEAVPAWCFHNGWYLFVACASCGPPLNYKSVAIMSDPKQTLETNWMDWGNNLGFMSRHPGGANFALCDGTVRFVSDTIDLFTYRMLANMADGEAVQVP
jgi:prepilin-type N-terminal cleavage/methylation domain-containing protein/prepilin-type processing-associated H-X9-DG protein